MNYRLLGHSGLRVSELSLGTMTFGEDWGWGASKEESKKIYDAYREAGGNFIDTANLYTNGASERLLGDFMSGHRNEIVLATKYTNAPPGKDPNAGGNHRKSMFQAVEGSLKRLKTDYIDLYWLHIWDQITPVEEVMRAFDDLAPGQGALCGSLRRPRLVDCPGKHAGVAAGLVAVRRAPDRVQPDRAHRRARTHSHGQSTQHRADRLVAAGRRHSHRQVQFGRARG